MSKLVKGVKKGFKSIFKGVKKVFKKITKSFVGKLILAAIVIYTGGVLLGAWGQTGPLSGMWGSWSGTTAAAGTTVSTTAPVVSTGGVLATAPETAAVLESASAVTAPITAGGTLATAPETAAILEGAGTAGSALSTATETAAVLEGIAPVVEETLLGSLWSGVKSAGAWAQANPVPSYMLMQGVSSALTPDQPNEIDILNEQDKLRRERYAGMGTFERTPRLSGRSPQMLYQQPGVPWHVQAAQNKG